MVARNQPLPDILNRLVQLVERQREGVAGSVLLTRHGRAVHAAAPSLPPAYTRAVDRRTMALKTDFFTLAVLSGETVVVDNITTDPRWGLHREIADAHGLRACWAMPLRSGEGLPLGSFVVYSRTPRAPAASPASANW